MHKHSTFTILSSILIAVSAIQAEGGAKQVTPGNRAPLTEQEAPLMGRPAAVAPRDVQPIPGIVLVKLLPNTEKERGYGPARASSFGITGLDATLRRFQVKSVERTKQSFPTPSSPGK